MLFSMERFLLYPIGVRILGFTDEIEKKHNDNKILTGEEYYILALRYFTRKEKPIKYMLDLFLKSHHLGFEKSAYFVAHCYKELGVYDQMIKFLELGKNNMSFLCVQILVCMYENGIYVKKDLNKALKHCDGFIDTKCMVLKGHIYEEMRFYCDTLKMYEKNTFTHPDHIVKYRQGYHFHRIKGPLYKTYVLFANAMNRGTQHEILRDRTTYYMNGYPISNGEKNIYFEFEEGVKMLNELKKMENKWSIDLLHKIKINKNCFKILKDQVLTNTIIKFEHIKENKLKRKLTIQYHKNKNKKRF